jgi:hypothetical protein
MLGANACTIQAHYPTRTNACMQHNRVDGAGIGFGTIFKKPMLMLESYVLNVSKSIAMYRRKQA